MTHQWRTALLNVHNQKLDFRSKITPLVWILIYLVLGTALIVSIATSVSSVCFAESVFVSLSLLSTTVLFDHVDVLYRT